MTKPKRTKPTAKSETYANNWPKIAGEAYGRLRRIAEIIEHVDLRCMADDGPVGLTKDNITTQELKRVYRLAKSGK